MRRYMLRVTGMIFPLFPALLLLAACGSNAVPQQAAATSPPAITPTPTLPTIPRTLIHFTTQDHVLLDGWLYWRGSTTAIICSHEHPGSKADWSYSAPWFAARGYMVLAYAFRSWGDSQGLYDPNKLDRDVLAAIAFTRSRGAKKVILLDASMDADISVIAAAETQVAGVIATFESSLPRNCSSTAKEMPMPLMISRCFRTHDHRKRCTSIRVMLME